MIAINPFTLHSKVEKCKETERWMNCTHSFISKEAAEDERRQYLSLSSALGRGYIATLMVLTFILLLTFIMMLSVLGWPVMYADKGEIGVFLAVAMTVSFVSLVLVGMLHPFMRLPDPGFLEEVNANDILRLKDVSDTEAVQTFMGQLRSRDNVSFRLGQLNRLIEAGEKELKASTVNALCQKFKVKNPGF